MGVDLHVHSISSGDGEFSAEELVVMAKTLGLDAIAITDHDTVNSVEEGLFWGEKHGVEVLPACEFSTSHQGIMLHILAYYLDLHNQAILELFAKVEEDRQKAIDLQIQKLEAGGFFLDKEMVMEDCHYTTPYPGTYTNVIFADPRNSENPIIRDYLKKPNYIMEFLLDNLVQGKPYYIEQYIPETIDVIRIIKEGGGVPILAHPGIVLKKKETAIIDDLINNGIVGLEVYTSGHNEEQEKYYYNYCRENGLIYTCGSDFHGKFKPRVKMGDIRNNNYDVVEDIKRKRG